MSLDTFSLEQNKTSLTDASGAVQYQITLTASVTPGTDVDPAYTLDQNVFVYSFTSDSSETTFARIASISDLGNLKNSRAAAANAGHYEYRDNTLVLKYTDLDTAINASTTATSRVSEIIAAYIKYQQQFKGTSTTSIPLATDASLVSVYSAAYSSAVAARAAAESELAELQAAYDLLKVKNEILSTYEKWVSDTAEIAEDVYDTMLAVFNALLSADVNDATTGNPVLLTQGDYLTGAKLSEVYRLHQIIHAQYTYRDAELQALTVQENSSKDNMASKSAEVTTLSTVEAAALSDLATFCPEVDPSTLS